MNNDSDAVYALECEGKTEEAQYVRKLEAELRAAAQAIVDNQECKTKGGKWVVVLITHINRLTEALLPTPEEPPE